MGQGRTRDSRDTFVVIGGGLTGMVAARELARAGARVALLEAAEELGGMIRPFSFEGRSHDRYYHLAHACDGAFLSLVHELLGPEALRWRPARIGVFLDGRAWPFATPADLLGLSPLAPPTRLRLAALGAFAAQPLGPGVLDRVSATRWLRATLGDEGYERIWAPLLNKKFGPHAARIPASWIHARMRRMVASRGLRVWRRDFAFLPGGAHTLIAPLRAQLEASGVEIRTGAPVRALALAPGGVRVVAGDGWRLERPRAVLSTIPLTRLAALIEGPVRLARPLPRVDYLPVRVLVLVMRRRATEYLWLNANDPDFGIPGIIEYSNLDDSLGDRHLLYVPFYADGERFAGLSAAELLAAIGPDLRRLAPDLKPEDIRSAQLFSDPHGQCLYAGQGEARATGQHDLHPGLVASDSFFLFPDDRSLDGCVTLARGLSAGLLRGFPVSVPARGR